MTNTPRKTPQQQKAERLAEALRANLRRRKAPKVNDKAVSSPLDGDQGGEG
jgi:hypothetical protein